MRIQTSIKHHGFLMPLAAIKKNVWDLSINRYKEMVHKGVVYNAPKMILDRIKKISSDRLDLANKLNKTL
jgi:type I restriction enzyme M protein